MTSRFLYIFVYGGTKLHRAVSLGLGGERSRVGHDQQGQQIHGGQSIPRHDAEHRRCRHARFVFNSSRPLTRSALLLRLGPQSMFTLAMEYGQKLQHLLGIKGYF